jgi:catechol 2,3-dioxygenase-like lactoylglutathione lyase family enzyme
MLDHLIYAVPDLDQAVSWIEESLGARVEPGGQHPGRGTHNAVLSIGQGAYLEIIAPDPTQMDVKDRWFSVEDLMRPHMAGWAAKADDLPAVVASAKAAGVPIGEVGRGSRMRPDGVLLEWEFTLPDVMVAGGLVPFFIKWGPRPPISGDSGVELVDFRAEHPSPDEVLRMLVALGLSLPVSLGERPALIARLRGPAGELELR